MTSFFPLLLRNLLVSVLLGITLLFLATSSYSDYLNDISKSHKNLVVQLVKDNQTLSSAELAKILQNNSVYQHLVITRSSETSPFEFSNLQSNFLSSLITEPNTDIFLQDEDVNITYILSHSKTAEMLTQAIILAIIGLIILATIATFFNGKSLQAQLAKVNALIKEEVNALLSDADKQPQSDQSFSLPALNSAIAKVKERLDILSSSSSKLASDAFVDQVTRLNNRARFVQYYDKKNEGENAVKFGVLSITRCSELQTINKLHGYQEGDNYVCKVAGIMKKEVERYKNGQLFRLNSSDFAVILPNTTIKDAEKFTEELLARFNEYQLASDLDSVAYTGMVSFEKDESLGELLALADTSISVAQTQKTNGWFAQTDTSILSSSSASYGNQSWRQEIDSVLENQRVNLMVQNITPSNRNARVYGEIQARFLNGNGEVLPTSSFFAMAEKLDKIVAIDRLIVEKAIEEITQKNLGDMSFGINISARSIHDEHFLIWLERRLLRDTSLAKRLVFEITEYGLQQNIKTSKRFIDMVHRIGARVTVERFGVGLTSFKFFRDLKPDFIKMDSTYTRNIDDDKNNQYFLRLMVDLAHRLSITVLAEAVETQSEKFTLDELFIDGCQGFYIGKPSPL